MPEQDTTMDAPSHTPGTLKGEEQIENQGKEPGRVDTGTDEAGRSTGTNTARNSTGVNAEDREPIDPAMPNMPPA